MKRHRKYFWAVFWFVAIMAAFYMSGFEVLTRSPDNLVVYGFALFIAAAVYAFTDISPTWWLDDD